MGVGVGVTAAVVVEIVVLIAAAAPAPTPTEGVAVAAAKHWHSRSSSSNSGSNSNTSSYLIVTMSRLLWMQLFKLGLTLLRKWRKSFIIGLILGLVGKLCLISLLQIATDLSDGDVAYLVVH
ncbi:hypothetical protein PoB_001046100 [Plakobranchus ocellatus]|uniref:Uncharacterized protein n=1 Tax=Plakobranchus ocellatus TaxID=259542 RepID=A0AAV3YKZ3_9GAST|nr:hypothetical protein PoB_001046100 [Plakobranchus ocellatus]